MNKYFTQISFVTLFLMGSSTLSYSSITEETSPIDLAIEANKQELLDAENKRKNLQKEKGDAEKMHAAELEELARVYKDNVDTKKIEFQAKITHIKEALAEAQKSAEDEKKEIKELQKESSAAKIEQLKGLIEEEKAKKAASDSTIKATQDQINVLMAEMKELRIAEQMAAGEQKAVITQSTAITNQIPVPVAVENESKTTSKKKKENSSTAQLQPAPIGNPSVNKTASTSLANAPTVTKPTEVKPKGKKEKKK